MMSLADYDKSRCHNDMEDKGIVGTCQDMCPREEVNLRKREKLIHVLEVTNSGYKMVKSYSRSAASAMMAVPRLLRPYPVLLDTVQYLLLDLSNREDVKISVMYDFLNDRLRSVRQDMTIQRLSPEECTILLEPMIRFYIYYAYRLCEHPINEYDPVLNKKYMLECLKWFLSCYDKIDRGSAEVDSIVYELNALNISKEERLECDRKLMECLYILCNLDDVHPLYRYLSLPKAMKKVSTLKLSYNIALANLHGNYIRMRKLAQGLCPLTFAAFCLYLPAMQRRALHVMSHGYSSRQLTVAVGVVQQWLAFNSPQEVRDACAHYGLTATDVVAFSKTAFKLDVDLPRPIKNYQVKLLQSKLEDILTYTVR